MGPWMHGGWDNWGWMLGWQLVTWVLLAAIVVGVVLALRGGTARRTDRQDAQSILAERYARGEIDTDEYHERLEALR